ncbi:hypothetical protein ONS95_008232 [Cadophora gregata]|uniref:uncharacterized protein n=1 Tax=Cadophora gregata TaxID=51156 RepID=UPI0026DABAFB|nr:uncharacterized protein ONS95_008232 [Cadophora gregata]KAK0100272.1 hypothetical protein ONS96_007555 [Cadophora gregata f. sp. sojae]KAK0126648.1 hypothetical protein ONS95_008232 [Cadophora gregata]
MKLTKVFTLLLTTLSTSTSAVAVAGNACQSLPYKELLFLSTNPPAQSFCAKAFPKSPVLTTVTATVTPVAKRATKCTGAACNAWENCKKNMRVNVLSTLCGCIEVPKTSTVTVTSTATVSTSFSATCCSTSLV